MASKQQGFVILKLGRKLKLLKSVISYPIRIKSKISEKGELPLGYASSCIEGLKELILYSACAENQAEAVCMRTTNSAKQILDNFRLAQTEKGSFIINIDIKVVDEENEQMVLPGC